GGDPGQGHRRGSLRRPEGAAGGGRGQAPWRPAGPPPALGAGELPRRPRHHRRQLRFAGARRTRQARGPGLRRQLGIGGVELGVRPGHDPHDLGRPALHALDHAGGLPCAARAGGAGPGAAPVRILLARHGETGWNREGRYQGQEDIPLSDTGVKQALRLGELLRDVRVDRAVASPLGRAYHTARLALGDARADMIEVDQGLMEIAHGSWEGKLASEIRESDPERLAAWRDTPDKVQMPGGESLKAVLERAWPAFCAACDGLGPDDTLFVVSHDAVNRV